MGQRKRLGLWLIIISCRFSRFSRRRRARRSARQPFCFGFFAASSAGILAGQGSLFYVLEDKYNAATGINAVMLLVCVTFG